MLARSSTHGNVPRTARRIRTAGDRTTLIDASDPLLGRDAAVFIPLAMSTMSDAFAVLTMPVNGRMHSPTDSTVLLVRKRTRAFYCAVVGTTNDHDEFDDLGIAWDHCSCSRTLQSCSVWAKGLGSERAERTKEPARQGSYRLLMAGQDEFVNSWVPYAI